MIDSSLISPQDAILHLEKLIGIERRSDFAEQTLSGSQFDQVHINALIMSEYAEEALNQIKCQLGYLPRRDVTWPSEPPIRQAVFDYDYKHGNIDTLFDDCTPHIEEIFIRDMKAHDIDDYPEEIYQLYHTLLPEFKDAALARILRFLENEYVLKHSIYAELMIRCHLTKSLGITSIKRTQTDYEAQSVIWYRNRKDE